MKRASKKTLGAATDDPKALAVRAIKEAEHALRTNDAVGFREAAEKGWLAASSAADVAAAQMRRPIPGGASGRKATLDVLETAARLRRGTLLAPFEAARTVLHGECFHGDECPSRYVVSLLESVNELVNDTLAALAKRRRRK